jgi:hypothetical protein
MLVALKTEGLQSLAVTVPMHGLVMLSQVGLMGGPVGSGKELKIG